MAPNTRNFLLGSAVIVVAGLCTGLVAYYSGALPGRDAARAEFSYIPSDASAVAFADVRHIMDSEFRQKLRETMPTGAEKDRLLQATGIDIERDIDSVVAGLTGGDASGAVVVLRGRFDQDRIEALAVGHGARQEQYGGRALLVGMSHGQDGEFIEPAARQHVPSLAFLDDNLLAIGDVTGVRRAIDVSVSGNSVTANSDMMRVIGTVQGTGHAWLVGRADRITGEAPVPEQIRSHVEGIEWLSVSASIDRDVHGLIRAEARDDQSAEQLRTILAGALATARMFANQDPRAAAALNSVQTTGSGRNVELSFAVPAELLEMVRPAAPHMVEPAAQ